MKSYKQLYREYLESYVRQGDMWEEVYGDNMADIDPVAEVAFKTLVRANEALVRELVAHPDTEVHTYFITGCLRGDSPSRYNGQYLDHYVIDQTLKEKYGELYTADSEHGCFFGYAHHSIGKEVFDFIAETFPTLGMSGQACRETLKHYPGDFHEHRVLVPGARNTSSARKTLEEMS